jgi:hypothetical protein
MATGQNFEVLYKNIKSSGVYTSTNFSQKYIANSYNSKFCNS